MKKIKRLLFVFITLFLFGCASSAKMENMVYTVPAGEQKPFDEALKKEISVTSVSGGEETNPAWTSEISSEAYLGALKRSLAAEALLSETGRYRLKVEILKAWQPLFGFNLTVSTHVQYVLVDTKDNSVVLDETIVVKYTATVGDAFIAVKRLRLANEGSVRKNIEGFMNKLSELEIKVQDIYVMAQKDYD